MMHGREKSDPAIVAGKSANKGGRPSAEPMEPRAGAKGNTVECGTRRTPGRGSVSSGLDRVRQAARERKKEKFTALLHHVDVDLLRHAYRALKQEAAAVRLTEQLVNYILDADIAEFFDTVQQDWLIKFVEHRIADRRIARLIRKWLKAGVMEDGVVRPGTVGTPQGAVVSPVLANIYLHYVFDLWSHQWRRRHARGEVILVRYADDIVAGFEHQAEAERFLAALRERMAAFGLRLHPEKTRLIEFGRQAAANRRSRGLSKPETFTFLGFTHICGRSRRGAFQLKRKTRADRMRATLRAVKEALRRRMHEPIDAQGRWLGQVARGFFAYHAIPTNASALWDFRYHLTDLWRRALRRRSQKDATNWQRMSVLEDRWLPRPRITHPWPSQRFAVRHPRWEPGAGIPHAGICAGGAW